MFHYKKYQPAGFGWIVVIPILLYFLLTGLFQAGAQDIGGVLNSPVEDFLNGAIRPFERSQVFAERSLNFGVSSEAYRILADALTQQMKHPGLLYQLTIGPNIKKVAQLALDLDPGNVKVRIALALYLFRAPSIPGGSIDKDVALRLYPRGLWIDDLLRSHNV